MIACAAEPTRPGSAAARRCGRPASTSRSSRTARAPRATPRAWGRTSRDGSDRRRARSGCTTWPSGPSGAREAARSVAQELTDSPSAVRLPSRRTSCLVTPSHRAGSRRSFNIGHLFPSMVRPELAAVQQAPEEVFQERTAGRRVRRGLELFAPECRLAVVRESSQGTQIKFFDQALIGKSRSDRPCEPASGIGDLAVDQRAVDQVEFRREAAPEAPGSSQEICLEQRPRMSSDSEGTAGLTRATARVRSGRSP